MAQVHKGKVVGFRNKAEIEKLMQDLDAQYDNEQEAAVKESKAQCYCYVMIMAHATSF